MTLRDKNRPKVVDIGQGGAGDDQRVALSEDRVRVVVKEGFFWIKVLFGSDFTASVMIAAINDATG